MEDIAMTFSIRILKISMNLLSGFRQGHGGPSCCPAHEPERTFSFAQGLLMSLQYALVMTLSIGSTPGKTGCKEFGTSSHLEPMNGLSEQQDDSRSRLLLHTDYTASPQRFSHAVAFLTVGHRETSLTAALMAALFLCQCTI